MTIPEFTKAMGVSKATLYDSAKRDKLPVKAIHVGGKGVTASGKTIKDLLITKQKNKKIER